MSAASTPAESPTEESVVAWHATGQADIRSIQSAMLDAWQDITTDPQQARLAAEALGIGSEEVRASPLPPVRVDSNGSNLGTAEIGMIVLTWLAADVLLPTLTKLARDELEKRLKRLWNDVLLPKIEDRLGRDAVGRRQPESSAQPTENSR